MKKFRHHFLIYFITASILISGNGIVLAIHTCLSSVCTDVSFFKESSGCSKRNKSCSSDCNKNKEKKTLTLKCCTSEVAYHKINAPFLPQKALSVPSINLISLPIFSFNAIVNSHPIDCSFIPIIIPLTLPFVHQQLLI